MSLCVSFSPTGMWFGDGGLIFDVIMDMSSWRDMVGYRMTLRGGDGGDDRVIVDDIVGWFLMVFITRLIVLVDDKIGMKRSGGDVGLC